MNFIEEMGKLLSEIRADIRFIEKYLRSVEDDNIVVDCLTVEAIIENLSDNVNNLYSITN